MSSISLIFSPLQANEDVDLTQTLINEGNFSTLLTAAGAAGLVETLQGDGPFTLFAPNDEAFAQLPAETLNGLLAEPDALAQVLLYHVVPGAVNAATVVTLDTATTAQGQNVRISSVNGVMINEANVIETDLQASNGIIHVIDSVLVPASETPAPGDIPSELTARGNFSTLLTAVGAAGLVETLQGDGPFTLFAPTDEAFAQLPTETLNGLLADPTALAQVLLYHVVPGSVDAATVVTLDTATTAQGQTVRISSVNGVTVNDANVIETDLQASNGIIHVIDSVLVPASESPAPADIPSELTARGNFNTLLTAVGAAGLVETLQGDGPFTLFAPNDEAFAQLPAETLNGLLADPAALAQVLLYHVVPGSVDAATVVTLDTATTAQGQTVRISSVNGVTVNDANVIETDLQASNGNIHVIDSVLVPVDPSMALAVQIVDGKVQVSWPIALGANAVLETTSSLPSGAWQRVQEAIIEENGNAIIQLDAQSSQGFFRLSEPR